MARYDESLGTMTYDNLIASTALPLLTAPRQIKANQGTLKRGTLLALSSGTAGTGEMVLFGTAAGSNETLTANAVLCDDVDTGTSEAVTALVYLTGHFQKDGLTVKEGGKVKATDFEALRGVGIIIEGAPDTDAD